MLVRLGFSSSLLFSGAGTGIFTSNLANAPGASDKIYSITAVEPSSGMRQAFNSNEGLTTFIGDVHDGKKKPYIQVKDGSFGDIPVPDGSIDIIIGKRALCHRAALHAYLTRLNPLLKKKNRRTMLSLGRSRLSICHI